MILIAALQAPPLVKQKKWPELAGFALLWTAAAAYALALTAGAKIPSPSQLFRSLLIEFYRLVGLDIKI